MNRKKVISFGLPEVGLALASSGSLLSLETMGSSGLLSLDDDEDGGEGAGVRSLPDSRRNAWPIFFMCLRC